MKRASTLGCVIALSAWVGAATANPNSYRLDLTFATGKSEIAKLTKQQADQLKNIARDLEAYPYARLDIEGHTDNVGTNTDNLVLSQKRADAVRELLMSQYLIAGSRITAKGYGDSKPLADNKTAKGRASNRRIMATVIRVDNPATGSNGQL